jgi:probable HAF family extracellular repeat protein
MKHRAFLAQLAGLVVLALTLVCAVGQASGAGPTITDLGVLPGGSFSTAGGINAIGQVAGSSASGVGDRAFLYDNGPLLDLGTLGGNRSFAYGIDAASRVVGRARNVQGRFHAFLWDAVGGMVDLGTLPGGTSSTAYSINGSGQVVGESNFLDSPFAFHGFLWTSGGGMVDLGILSGGSFSVAYSINESGQVAGEGDDASGGTRALLWNGGVPQDLGMLSGGTYATARAVNNQGQVVGWGDVADGSARAFLWDPVGGFTDLGTLPGGSESWALGVNDLGQVVGQAITASGDVQAFVWDSASGMQGLPPLPGGVVSVAVAINNVGQVAGESDSASAMTHAVRWQLNRAPVAQDGSAITPQDVPVSVALAGSDPDGDGVAFAIVTPPAHGSLSGVAPDLLYTPNPGWSGSDAFSFTVSDGTLTSAPATVDITVVPDAPPPQDELAGRMAGSGHLEELHHFVFLVGRGPTATPAGRVHYWHVVAGTPQEPARARHRRLDRFVATTITAATFSDDPAIKPGKKPTPVADSVVFSGTGRWNGLEGYTFEVKAADAGEPGRGRDSFAIVIKAPDGTPVADAGGVLAGGNVQSLLVRPVVAAGTLK